MAVIILLHAKNRHDNKTDDKKKEGRRIYHFNLNPSICGPTG
jgi:hypothetical protein